MKNHMRQLKRLSLALTMSSAIVLSPVAALADNERGRHRDDNRQVIKIHDDYASRSHRKLAYNDNRNRKHHSHKWKHHKKHRHDKHHDRAYRRAYRYGHDHHYVVRNNIYYDHYHGHDHYVDPRITLGIHLGHIDLLFRD